LPTSCDMTDVVIRAESLGKKYLIGHDVQRERYTTLREVIARRVKRLARSGSNGSRATTGRGHEVEEFWALREINLEIQRGEVVGIIGRNGAGKSTFLKILSRITEPSEGRVEITGRVASLLEVGTGFHPELTGRENIYVNGAILGMSRAEVRRKFDEIVAFADVEKFLDTPVKRYSSGMHVRLAFSVAAHMEPEILIVDEVLAVGDAEFQEKCVGKMNDVAKSERRTVLFVSHNMSAIQHLCSRAVLLRSGRIEASGETTSTVAAYLSDVRRESSISLVDWTDRNTTGEARITKLEVGDATAGNNVPFGQDFRFRIHATFNEPFADPSFGLIIHDTTGVPLVTVHTIHQGVRLGKVDGNIIIEGVIPKLNLYPGRYFLSPWIMDAPGHRDLDFPRMCAELNIVPMPGPHGDLRLNSAWGKYFLPSEWKSAQS
jgi:lipopolysaccharide transport system ATP-binding protein